MGYCVGKLWKLLDPRISGPGNWIYGDPKDDSAEKGMFDRICTGIGDCRIWGMVKRDQRECEGGGWICTPSYG